MKKRFTQKQKFAILESAEKVGINEASRLSEVHFTTVYIWQRQLKALGKDKFLAYKAPSPGRGQKKITPEKEEGILTTWKRYPSFGPGQVRNQLRRQGVTISIRTVRQIMEAKGYKSPRKKAPTKEAINNFEASRPLELAQMDILEFFINKLKVYLIILLDDFSRFILGWRLLTQTSIDEVISLIQESINRYGKMEELLTDRGFVFYSWQGANRFEKYLELERIDHTHARPHHPQTLGKIEALNGHLKRELIKREHFSGIEEALAAISRWVFHYNYERTHQGIGGLLVPANPKGNGTDEGAFSQLKQVLGTIHLETSSPKALAKAILEKMISIYIAMRNRIPSRSSILTPQESMKAPECQVERDLERQRLKDHNRRRMGSEEDQEKLERLGYLIRYHGISPESAALERAERTIKAFELKAIGAAEEAFHRAVTRNSQKASLPYFFGILKNIQQERDDVAYKTYCYQRYNEQLMLKLKQQQEQIEQPEYSIETVIGILIQAVRANILVVKELAIKKARQWTHELMASYSYPGALKKRFADAIGALTDITIDLKNKVWELIEQFLNVKPLSESVTHFS